VKHKSSQSGNQLDSPIRPLSHSPPRSQNFQGFCAISVSQAPISHCCPRSPRPSRFLLHRSPSPPSTLHLSHNGSQGQRLDPAQPAPVEHHPPSSRPPSQPARAEPLCDHHVFDAEYVRSDLHLHTYPIALLLDLVTIANEYQTAGHPKDTASKAARASKHNCASAWMHRFVPPIPSHTNQSTTNTVRN
jgi:hypothetical protein